MAVFTSPILDDFNRSNEVPLSAAAGWDTSNWQALADVSHGRLRVVSGKVNNEVAPPVTGGIINVQVRASASPADQECYARLPSSQWPGLSTMYLLCRAAAPGAAGSAYAAGLSIGGASNPQIFSFTAFNQVNLVTTARSVAGTIPATAGVNCELGGLMGFRVVGEDPVRLEVWATISGVWRAVARAYDYHPAQIKGAGRLGIMFNTNTNQASQEPLDDFGGGALTGPTAVFNSDVYPGYTGAYRTRIANPALITIPPKITVQQGTSDRPYLARRAWIIPTQAPAAGPARSGVEGGGIAIHTRPPA